MNPHTNQFEPETKDTPESWSRFKVGEVITIRGVNFAIESIEANRLALRPASPVEVLGASAEPYESYTKRLERKLRER